MSEADALKAEIEYAAHVLRYAGKGHSKKGGHHDEEHHKEHHHDETVLAQIGDKLDDEERADDDHGHGHGGYSDDDPQETKEAETFRRAILDAKAGFTKLIEDSRQDYSDAV